MQCLSFVLSLCAAIAKLVPQHGPAVVVTDTPKSRRVSHHRRSPQYHNRSSEVLSWGGGLPGSSTAKSSTIPTVGTRTDRSPSNWSLVPLNAAAGVTFDVERSVRVPCASTTQPRQLWCVVNGRVSRGSIWRWAHTNIGHAAEYLFKCWSFISHEQSLRHEGQNETRLLVDYIQRGQPLLQAFPRELMAAMGLTLVGPRQQPTACAVLWAVPSRKLWPGWGEAWFASPPDAWRLTAACIGRQPFSDAATQLSLDSRPSLHNSAEKQPLIGVLLRGPSRSGESSRRDWPHAAQLAGLLGEASGVRGGSLFWLNNISLATQAHRVREYDIIITTHGSHSVSLAFIKPCTVVLELLHDSYLVPMFGQLAAEAGGRSFFLHNGGSVTASVEHTQRHVGPTAYRANYRSRNEGYGALPAERVAEALPALAAAHRRCLDGKPEPTIDDAANIPSLGGYEFLNASARTDPERCLSCAARDDRDMRCCASRDARAAYEEGGYGCARCLPLLREGVPSGRNAYKSSCSYAKKHNCRMPDMVASH